MAALADAFAIYQIVCSAGAGADSKSLALVDPRARAHPSLLLQLRHDATIEPASLIIDAPDPVIAYNGAAWTFEPVAFPLDRDTELFADLQSAALCDPFAVVDHLSNALGHYLDAHHGPGARTHHQSAPDALGTIVAQHPGIHARTLRSADRPRRTPPRHDVWL